jgi:hypothetical protein
VEKCLDLPKEVCSKVVEPRKVTVMTKSVFCDSSKAAKSGEPHFPDASI